MRWFWEQPAFDVDTYEDIFNITNGTEKIVEIKGVDKMTDLKDYQQIMENIVLDR